MIQCQAVEKTFTVPGQGRVRRWTLDALNIARNERVLISGPSGCGKTTLLNLLAGLLRPDAGSIRIHDVEVSTLSTSEADIFRGRHIGMIFQSFQLLTPVTVLDNVLLGARYGRKWGAAEARTRAETLLEQVGLSDRRSSRPAQLSVGEQQRVAIARALINEPPVLLADEPTASLDAVNAGNVLDLLFTLCAAQETTLAVVSHDATIAPRFDRVIDAGAWMRMESREVDHV